MAAFKGFSRSAKKTAMSFTDGRSVRNRRDIGYEAGVYDDVHRMPFEMAGWSLVVPTPLSYEDLGAAGSGLNSCIILPARYLSLYCLSRGAKSA